ncbi:MAG: 2-aminoethylphosphonate--pyruvate transaminase [Rhodospirillaceae bacterium]|jgi:2-aminoethylphosphonate-pyruvate transaminase|nr:2-aminoethylphosphonate--pyruvate transaminase [Rhodospirillaceae bacterium]MBT4463416.1 2-aminoethylphosphonate--pyruvate transaminase [Rhodospirillaceae bacterium]MBT5013491.1 2-aminoethylphosphonate--pyruvate transaminase [Rhodospirillaceae bacterium]MBT5308977.1 2-aminoethylphosphonate--pyruvate transaminase [Rhodospirillaceae bacterium]MBT6407504.1 2-aminoethylphosphonate--pyruvate transaminase [Rhodospirillaceae bacterium]
MSTDPWLLTPGPLSTAGETKEAMLHDVGSRDAEFIATNARIRARLLDIAEAAATHVCVPVQGSGTFAVEAAIGTLIPRDGKTLILINGAYGQRMARIMDVLGRAYVTLETDEDTPADPNDVDAILAADADIGHVLVVHCETTSGILNPVQAIAEVVAGHGRSLLIDAMSSFGAIELSAHDIRFDAVMASSNKCLEGVPGMGFVIVRQSVLKASEGNAHSLSLDLFDQWQAMENNGQWRFTPPTHVIAAFDAALDLFDTEGGQPGRLARYSNNCRVLVDGMREIGFKTLLDDDLQAPIIITFHMPDDENFDFQSFYDGLKDKGFVIYPGKLTVADSFRMGCIGALTEIEMRGALDAVRETLSDMGVSL